MRKVLLTTLIIISSIGYSQENGKDKPRKLKESAWRDVKKGKDVLTAVLLDKADVNEKNEIVEGAYRVCSYVSIDSLGNGKDFPYKTDVKRETVSSGFGPDGKYIISTTKDEIKIQSAVDFEVLKTVISKPIEISAPKSNLIIPGRMDRDENNYHIKGKAKSIVIESAHIFEDKKEYINRHYNKFNKRGKLKKYKWYSVNPDEIILLQEVDYKKHMVSCHRYKDKEISYSSIDKIRRNKWKRISFSDNEKHVVKEKKKRNGKLIVRTDEDGKKYDLFDDKKRWIEKYYYTPDGNKIIEYRHVYTDSAGLGIIDSAYKYDKYSENKNFYYSYRYKYDKNRKEIEKVQKYNLQNKYNSKERYIRNDKGYIIEEYKYETTEKEYKWYLAEKIKYDDEGRELEDSEYNQDGSLKNQLIFKYEYDNKGNWISKKTYKNNKETYLIKREIEYNEQ